MARTAGWRRARLGRPPERRSSAWLARLFYNIRSFLNTPYFVDFAAIMPQTFDELKKLIQAAAASTLPMDEASRMKRAAEQGFTHDVYHGTKSSFDEFKDAIRYGGYGAGDFGIHVTPSPETANKALHIGDTDLMSLSSNPETQEYLKGKLLPGEAGANVMPLKASIHNPVDMPDLGVWRDPQSMLRRTLPTEDGLKFDPYYLQDHNYNDPAFLDHLVGEADKIQRMQGVPAEQQQALWQHKFRELAQEHGYDSARYPNHTEGTGEPSYLLLDPRQLRSRFAAFDPEKRNSRNLLAGLAAATTGAGLALTDDQIRQAQAADPLWKRAGRSAFEGLTDFVSGLAGYDQGEGATKSNLGGQLVAAGLPLIPKIPHFSLPGGKVTAPDVHGVNQILEGDRAAALLDKLRKPGYMQTNNESGFAPAVRGLHELSDVSVPIADSLDTAATPKLPLTQATTANNLRDMLNRSTTKAGYDDIVQIRSKFDSGIPLQEINKEFPHLTRQSVAEIAHRQSFTRVK